ncbi:MAG: OsmC family protein [Winogradskyella sp.]|nr:OsmC family protein [Bacteroidia bacterium]NNF86299.1 OsmC family protein [Winogradskyella sp.]NNK39672.1 OsmC family protein [Winogradskyella sp.]NNL83946.1 OsmC family protein [Winogradskyella sp.]
MTSKVTYLGELRTSNTHTNSNSSYHTDAPLDNNGKGEAFSPTDTVATALANCMLTMMGIKARDLSIDLSGAEAEVTKTMASNPRRISKIKVVINFSVAVDERTKTILKNTALTCPVHFSLHPDIEKDIVFNWP